MKLFRFFLTAMLACTLMACAPEVGDEALIRQQLDEITQALEAKDMQRFLRPIAADFNAEQMDRRALRWLVFAQWQRHQSITVQLADVQIEMHEQVEPLRASVRFQAFLSGGSLLPDRVGWYTVETGWREDTADNWRMISAQWTKKI